MQWASVSSTKVKLPRLRADLVPRPRLQAELRDALLSYKLVLLTAPAGCGKTMALAGQLSSLPAGHAVAWVSASEDDDLQRLLAALPAALEPFDPPWRVSPAALPAMALERPAAALDELASALEGTEVVHGVMAFDDVHRIADPRVFAFLDRLLDKLPARWTVAMTSRVEPPLALARLLVQGQLAQFPQERLRFDRDEVQALLQAAHQPVTVQRVDELLARTNGWAAGLSMAMLAHASGSRQPGRLAQRRLFNYFAQEVLEQLPSPMQEFLVRCSVLPELTAERCARVSGDARAAHWLDELERRDLFVTVLDANELTLRLHDLFREFLESRVSPELLPALLLAAAQSEPDLVARTGFLLRAGAVEEAARRVLDVATTMIQAGASSQLLRLVEQFPEPMRTESAELAFVQGMCAWHRFEFKSMHLAMHKACAGFERNEQWQWAVQARGLASVALFFVGRLTQAFELWDAAPGVERQPPAEVVAALLDFLRSTQYGPYKSSPGHLMRLVHLVPAVDTGFWTSFFHVHYVYLGRWGMRAPMQALVDALEARADEGRPQIRLEALKLRAWLALWEGKIEVAQRLCDEVAQEARWLGEAASVVVPHQVLIATQLALRDDAAGARRILQDLADDASRGTERKSGVVFLNLLAAVSTASEDWHAAEMALAAIEALADKPQWPVLALQIATLRAELALHRGEAAAAASLLRPLLDRAMPCDCRGTNARLRVALARAELRAGTAQAAWAAVGPAVRLAMEAGEPLGLLMRGPKALEELAQASWPQAGDAQAVAYLRECAARARELRRGTGDADVPAQEVSDNTLSEREREVIQLVAMGQSNKLIARSLGLSPHTVKRHMARIFDKTGASSRGRVAAWYRIQVEGNARRQAG